MTYAGVIQRVERGRAGLTLIVQTDAGLRAVDVDQPVWHAIRADFSLQSEQELVGWEVEYDPEHGDLEIMRPPDAEEEDAEAGSDERTQEQ